MCLTLQRVPDPVEAVCSLLSVHRGISTTLPFLKVLMALAVASATPLPEAGLLFRKPKGMVWAKGGQLEEMEMELV